MWDAQVPLRPHGPLDPKGKTSYLTRMPSRRTAAVQTTTVSSKGQVVIPVWARQELDLCAGDELRVEVAAGDGERLLVLRRPAMPDVEQRLEQGYRWLEQTGTDPVAALHEARRIARVQERDARRPGRRRRARTA